jgi:hypothetical protein
MAHTPIHPDKIMADELDEIIISAGGLSRKIQVPANRITLSIAGKLSIPTGTVLKPGTVPVLNAKRFFSPSRLIPPTEDLEIQFRKHAFEIPC